MDFEILLAGLNHRNAPVDIREKYSLANYGSGEKEFLTKINDLKECLVLSTCNRVEVLGVGAHGCRDRLISWWAAETGGNEDELRRHLFHCTDLEAVRHIFEVASSLDSMVIGEPQILGQLKQAYRKSVSANQTGPIINRLLHRAFSVAKRVRNETAIAENAVSVSYAAVELARCIYGSLKDNSVLLIGAGEMAELAAMHLIQAGIRQLYVSNRTEERGRNLASRFNAGFVPFDDILESLKNIDIILASTGSPEPILDKAQVAGAMHTRKNRPMFFIDIAVPRDIDPAVNSLDNVYLYDIDDLVEVVEENRKGRLQEAEAARLIINEETEKFGAWLESLALQPTILDFLEAGENIVRHELQKAMKKLDRPDQEVERVLEKLAYSIVHKLQHSPLDWLKRPGMGKFGQEERIALIRKIFDLDKHPPFSSGY